LRPTVDDAVLSVDFGAHTIGMIDLRSEGDCGLVDIARAMPTTPQLNNNHQTRI